MRNPRRIHEIIVELEKLWNKYPDMRLGQLISDIPLLAGEDTYKDIYYIEDDEWLKMLKFNISIKMFREKNND